MRLIDLHCDWLLQYATETTVFDPALYEDIPARLGQAEAYLETTRATVLACYRCEQDWASQADPWQALGQLISRIEAEFPGRLLIGPADFARWEAEPESLAWGVLGVEGFDSLVRSAADLDRLPGLFERGVRVFQPVYYPTSMLGGSCVEGDDRGLTDLGRAFLQTLVELATDPAGRRPLLDLAHLNPIAAADVLAWFEADATRSDRLLLLYSHGALRHDGCTRPRAITLENLARLRALGGVIGFSVSPPFYHSPDELKRGIEAAAALPFRGSAGYEGIAIGTDFLGVSRCMPELSNAPAVAAWVEATFEPPAARLLLHDNARALLACAAGMAG